MGRTSIAECALHSRKAAATRLAELPPMALPSIPVPADRTACRSLVTAFAVMVGACRDATTSPPSKPPVSGSALSCAIDRTAGSKLNCAPSGSPAAAVIDASLRAALGPDADAATERAQSVVARDVYLGQQGTNVSLAQVGNSTYDSGTQLFTINVTVQNLTTQPLGTTDGRTPSAQGIRVFFFILPTVYRGSGIVTIHNPSGTAAFTAAGQPYFQYAGLLPGNGTSDPAPWQFDVPTTALSFGFKVYVAVQLPDESMAGTTIPAHRFDRIVAGQAHSCAVRPTTGASVSYCWGFNGSGGLGVGVGDPATLPLGTLGALPISVLSAGDDFTCALASGKPFCWGDNQRGELGTGSPGDQGLPAAVSSPSGSTYSAIASGAEFACAINSSGIPECWGDNRFGQLGDGTTNSHASPAPASGSPSFVQITAGSYHACGITSAGSAYCWGANSDGQLGDGTTTTRLVATPVSASLAFSRLAAGSQSTCGITTTGAVYCWGDNEFGLLGDGTTANRNTPTAVSGSNAFAVIAVGAFHACAATAAGATYCWGSNEGGQLGDGTQTDRRTPTPIAGMYAFDELSAGWEHSCGATSGGATYCWGKNDVGQLGDGTTSNHSMPTAVSLP